MLIEVSDRIRIEDSPPRKRAVATEELLSDSVTSSHYQVGAPDALGKPIELGQQMDYIDWKCADCDRVWSVYRLTDGLYYKQGEFPTMEEANAFALTL